MTATALARRAHDLAAIRSEALELQARAENAVAEAADHATAGDLLAACRAERREVEHLVDRIDVALSAQPRPPSRLELWQDFEQVYQVMRRRNLSEEQTRRMIGKYGPRAFKLLKW